MNSVAAFPLTDRAADAILAFDAGGPVRVGRFLGQAAALARQLPDCPYVINVFADRYGYLLGLCAAIIAGQCTLMPPNRQPQTLKQLADEFADSYLLGENGRNFDMPADDGLCGSSPDIPSDQLCAIAFTSGSTGKPKANRKYWRTLRTGAKSNAELLLKGVALPLNLVATVPPQHMWGMETSILLPLFAATAISHRTPFFPQDIADALASIPEPRGLISSPVHLEALLKSGVTLPPLQRVFTATAPLPMTVAASLEERFNTHVVDVFGCSESGILAVRGGARDSLWRLSDTFELVSRDDGILIRADHLPEDVAMPDIIEITGSRRFRWLGRHQDMINIAGKRGSLADLNSRLNAMPGVIDGVIFMPDGDRQRLAALVVAPQLEAPDILAYLKAHFEPVFMPRPLYLTPELPRQATGKLPRSLVLDLFESIRAGARVTQ